jgi:CelD/BcsL family acetyltransferase involved in cellulose biosynthesis
MATTDPSTTVEVFSGIDSLPADSLALLGGSDRLFTGLSWWRTVLDHAMPDGVAAQFVLIRRNGAPAAIFPMQSGGSAGYGSLTTPYTCVYTPLLAPALGPAERDAVFGRFGRFCRGHSVTRLDALPEEWPDLDRLVRGCARASLVALRFDHFGNWFEPVSGVDWTRYLDARPGALRETIRRRLRRAERLAEARFTLLTTPGEVENGIPAFEDIYARSWKEPEPFPRFNAALMRATAQAGSARLGVWLVGETPVATQFWVVEHGRATVLKLAHDEAFKAHSPGTVLSALMLRHLLDREHVTEIDYGRGDDPYKQGWAQQRRQRIGLLLATPWRLGGMVEMLKHKAGRLRSRMRPAGQALSG